MPAINTAKEVVKDVDPSIKMARPHMKMNCLGKDEPIQIVPRGNPRAKPSEK